jgi:lysophospholipase L1-like esterase
MKKIDILADIRSSEKITDAGSIDTGYQIIPEFADTCKTGIICIDDYSAEHDALNRFYDALEANNRPVRIAYFGDSFIEGDLLTCSLRNMFKKKYGGNGVGFVPINCITAGFRTTVITSANGWEEHCITDSIFTRSKQGISGHYFVPAVNATATFSCRTGTGKEVDTCSTASFYFITDGNLKFTTTVNRQIKQQHIVEGSSEIQKISVDGQIGHIKITVDSQGTNTRFFGVTLDNEKTGIVVDNYSLRGVSGENIKSVPAKTLKDFDKLRNYDLVILQYGLNVATKTQTKYDYYRKAMTNVINHLRNNLPNSDIMLVSVGDRTTKINGEMTTMSGVKSLLATQQQIASECGIAFWNLIEAMALDGGMAGYVKSKPSKANSDYTHINIRGGEQIAKHLFEALEYAKEKYIEKKKHNKLK